VAACTLAAVPVVFGDGATPQSLDLLDGTAWLLDELAGRLVRVNGATGTVDAELSLGSTVGGSVEQDGDTVLVSVDGTIHSLDLAELDWGGSVEGTGQLVVGDGVAYVVGPEGDVREVDPATLRTLQRTRVDGRPGRAVIVDGRLALPLDDGTVRIVEDGEQAGAVDVGRSGDRVHAVRVGRRLVTLNETRGTVQEVDTRRARVRSDADVVLPEGDLVVPAELPAGPLWLLAPVSGELVRVGVGDGEVARRQVVGPGSDVAGPAGADDRVYVVDRSRREIVEVDESTLQVSQRRPLDVEDASRVEVVTEGGYIFVNDAAGSKVVVIGDGEFRTVDKSRPGARPGSPTDQPETPDDGPGVGQDQGPADQPSGPPGPDGPPAPPAPPATDPPPTPVAPTAVAGDGSATVAWRPGAGTTPPTAYHVSYEGAGSPVRVDGGTTSVEVGGLTNGRGYRFTVWASNAYGESERVRTGEVEPNDEVPGRPSGVVATAGDAEADVRWEAADGRGNDVTGYVVTAEPGGRTTTVGGGATTATVTGLTNGTSYVFTVTAVNELDVQGEPSAPSQPVVPYGPPTDLTGLTHDGGTDGSLDLAWAASTSRTPVDYVVTLSPAVGGRTQWTTTALTWSGSGLAIGTGYTVTVTPTNDRGAGGSQSARVTPGRDATVATPTVTRTADRTFRVQFTYDGGGRPLSTCTVARSGGSAVAATCDGGTGTASVTVPSYATTYTFTASVTNELGGGTATSAGARSAAKPFTIRSDASAFDGTCTWNDDWGGRPDTRPYYPNPRHTCPEGTPAGDRPAGYLALGTTVRGECHVRGGSIEDDNLVSTTTWIRVTGRGYMPTIYFTNFDSSPTANLPAC
jgi:hypothetical protein